MKLEVNNMWSGMILKYIQALTLEDIENFAKKQNIILKRSESEIILNEIKNNFNEVVYHTEEAMKKIKDKLDYTTYLKLNELIDFYKKKYPDYLNYL
jgi:hypothetical protein